MQLFYPNKTTVTDMVPWNAQGAYTHQYPHDHASTISQMTTNTPQLQPQPPMHEIPPPPPPPPTYSIMGGRNNQAGSRHYQGGHPA